MKKLNATLKKNKMTEIAPRVITLGDSGVGKTSLIYRMKTGTFLEETSPTIGAGVTAVEVTIKAQTFPLQIWDTAGQEMYRNIIPIYFKGAVFAILVFAMDDKRSFDSLNSWLDEIEAHSDPNIGIVLVGNKYDSDNKVIDDDTARVYAAEHGLHIFFSSALTGQNVSEILNYIAIENSKRAELMRVPTPGMPERREKGDKDSKCC
ncbi:Ras-related protein Rab5 [Tritrichomonas foetus]|uniref:Ras-related protein Rab5 n=1 Tax=Tritrichomonas foetus TaxID=1144522 RepID=A0A1J4JEE0_9EUKA|nr:Ras-related protein Rab5 [Tritrichomonas foetus]|eukprot:OHS95805.1 Ras-related protein Rab5 [Tritrichomonas foetus]